MNEPQPVEVLGIADSSPLAKGGFRGVLRRGTPDGFGPESAPLRKGEESFSGEAEGVDGERLRIELAARATLSAIAASGETRLLALEGSKLVDAFEREFVFVGLSTRVGRESALLTGTAEVKESPETASVLAVLDATNRWIEFAKGS